VGIDEDKKVVKERIEKIFEKVKTKYSEVIEVADSITLDADSIKYVVGELQNFSLIESERDIIADAFETFIGYSLKGAQGQFFTPRNVIKLMVEIINPQPNELLIDPACGTGGFLVESLRHIWKVLDKQADEYGWSELALKEEKISSAIKCIKGLEKDDFLSKVAKAYMAILGDGKGGIFCEDS
jgi:type I restriction enzyme M protein